MKITHLLYLSEVPGSSPFSGAENHLLALLPALVRVGEEVELIALLWRGDSFFQVRQKLEELQTAGVKVTLIQRGSQKNTPREITSRVSAWFKLWKHLRLRRDNIIHVHLEMTYAPVVAWIAGCRKIVTTIHNGYDEPVYRTMMSRIRLHVLSRIFSHIIAITEHVRCTFVKATGTPRNRITTVYYGVALPNVQSYTKSEFMLPEDTFIVGYVGRLVEQKNLDVFLNALQKCPQVLGVLVGDGPQKGILTKQIESQQIENVRLLGAIPEAQRLMPMFDVFCLPSVWEGLGLVLIEAMLHHVPVIGSTRGAIPEVLGYGQYGLLAEPTSDGLAQAINQAFENRETLLPAMAEKAYTYARDRFSVARMVQGTLAVYRQVQHTG